MPDNPYSGTTPDPKAFAAELEEGPLLGGDLGDDDPWNYAPEEVLEKHLSAKLEGVEPQRYLVRMRSRDTGQLVEVPAVLNWQARANVGGLFWFDYSWWFYADSPEEAVRLWNQDVSEGGAFFSR